MASNNKTIGVYYCNYDDFIKLQEAIKKYPGSSEEAINEYLRNKGSRNLIDSTTQTVDK